MPLCPPCRFLNIQLFTSKKPEREVLSEEQLLGHAQGFRDSLGCVAVQGCSGNLAPPGQLASPDHCPRAPCQGLGRQPRAGAVFCLGFRVHPTLTCSPPQIGAFWGQAAAQLRQKPSQGPGPACRGEKASSPASCHSHSGLGRLHSAFQMGSLGQAGLA
jgi:hypothetical protein